MNRWRRRWSLRLLRYYRVVPDAAREKLEAQRQGQGSQPQPAAPVVEPTSAPTSTRPTAPRLPAVGDTFTGKVLDRDDDVIIVQVPGFSEENVFALLAVAPSVPKYRPGKDSAHVEVTKVRQTKSGKTVLEVKLGAKKS